MRAKGRLNSTRYKQECANCGKLYEAKRRGSKYCSKECRNSHYNKTHPRVDYREVKAILKQTEAYR